MKIGRGGLTAQVLHGLISVFFVEILWPECHRLLLYLGTFVDVFFHSEKMTAPI